MIWSNSTKQDGIVETGYLTMHAQWQYTAMIFAHATARVSEEMPTWIQDFKKDTLGRTCTKDDTDTSEVFAQDTATIMVANNVQRRLRRPWNTMPRFAEKTMSAFPILSVDMSLWHRIATESFFKKRKCDALHDLNDGKCRCIPSDCQTGRCRFRVTHSWNFHCTQIDAQAY